VNKSVKLQKCQTRRLREMMEVPVGRDQGRGLIETALRNQRVRNASSLSQLQDGDAQEICPLPKTRLDIE
jgi:hypothetical protein